MNNGANLVAFCELLHAIKYELYAKILGFKLESFRNDSKPCDIVCFSNSDYAGDPVSRRSVSGFILCDFGPPVSWQLKMQ